MASPISSAGIDYFEDRELRRHAGVFYLWALGVAAVISGDFSGWNLGFAVGGWGGMFLGTIIITIMYLGLTYSIAEMSPALPHTGGAYSFARTAFGPWGGFITGVAENVEYVLTPAVIVYFIGAYLTAIFDTPAAFQPAWWMLGYIVFVALNARGVELSFTVTTIVTLLAIAVLVIFFVSAIPFFDFGKYAMNIGADPATGAAIELPDGNGPFLPFGIYGVLASMPFAVWLFLAIEQLPLAAEESVDPKRDMPKGIMLGMFTLIVLGFLVLIFNPSIPIERQITDAAGVTTTVHGAFALGTSGEPILDGFRAIFASNAAGALAVAAVIGLVASFHAIIFASGPADLLAVAGRLFPAFPLRHPRQTQDAERCPHRRRSGRSRRDAGRVVRHGRREGRGLHRRRAAQHGGVRRDVLISAARPHLHPPPSPLSQYRASLSQSVRCGRGDADGDHRAGDHRLPACRSALPHRSDRRGDLVCAGDRLLRDAWPQAARAVTGGGVRRQAPRRRELGLGGGWGGISNPRDACAPAGFCQETQLLSRRILGNKS